MKTNYNNIEQWNQDSYNKFYYTNRLQNIHFPFMNPSEGFRLFVFTPSYINQKNIDALNIVCKKCGGNAVLNNECKAAGLYICEKCGKEHYRIFRWKGTSNDTGNIIIDNKKQLFWYSRLARTMYFTLGIWDNNEIKNGEDGEYGNLDKLKAWNLAIDIDVKNSLLLTPKNIERINNVLNLIRKDLNEIVPNSYELMSSGNGMYILLNHKLTAGFDSEMFTKTKLVWKSYQMCINDLINKGNIKNIIIDTNSTFLYPAFIKLPYTFHKKYNTISVPLEYDIDLNKLNNIQLLMNTKREDFSTFNINDYPKFYKRYDEKDKENLISFVNEYYNENITDKKSSSNTDIVKDRWGHIIKDTKFERISKRSEQYTGNKSSYISNSMSEINDEFDKLLEERGI